MEFFNRRQRVEIEPIKVSGVNQYYDCTGLVGWAVDVVCKGCLVTGIWSPEFEASYRIGPRRTTVKKHQYFVEDNTTTVKILFEQRFAKIGYRRATRFRNRIVSQIAQNNKDIEK